MPGMFGGSTSSDPRAWRPRRSGAARDGLEVGPLLLVGGIEGEHGGVGLDAPAPARLEVEGGPPVRVLGQALVLHRLPVAEDPRPAAVAVVERLLPVAE